MTSMQQAIDQYLQRGFGSMNKNDFEVWIFNELLNSRLKTMSNYAISVDLKLPESKVKRLRYEATLKYGCTNDTSIYAKQFETILTKAKFTKSGDAIKLVIEDIQLRKYLDSILKEDGRFSDSSFNSEIATIEIDDFEALLNKIWTSKDWTKFNKELKKIIKGKKLTISTMLKKIGKNITKQGGNKIIDLSIDGLIKQLPIVLTLI